LDLFTRRHRQSSPRGSSCTTKKNLVRNHPLDFRCVRIAHQDSLSQLALALLALGSEHVAQMRMVALHFSCSCFLEALRCAFVRFQFRHKSSGVSFQLSAFASLSFVNGPCGPTMLDSRDSALEDRRTQLVASARRLSLARALRHLSSAPESRAAYCLPVSAGILRSHSVPRL
jgi:hypothetical protein